jgi:GntR family transcriptional repressor for pyruvate dehydrogenase complex
VKRDAAVEAVFKPVRPPTTFEETVERLGTAIRIGLLSPGSQLPPERELAGELQISRSGGTFVAERPPLSETRGESLGDEAWEVLEHRVAVETGAVILAAERAAAEQLEKLAVLVEKMAEPPAFEAYRRADIRFHIGVAEAAGSPRLVREMTEVQGQMSDLIARIAHPQEVLTRSNEQHRRLVALLREGDYTRAVPLMRKHIRGTEHILAGLI